MGTPNSPERLPHLHNFRGLAIVFIVATHCMSVFDWSQSLILQDVLARIVANGTVFFLFIAGYLFHHLSKDHFVVVSYWKKKTLNVVMPYIVVSLPAIFFFTFLARREGVDSAFYAQPIWRQVVDFLLTGSHLAPFWFIPTILVFYLAAPVLRYVFSHPWAYALLPLLFIVGVFVPRGEHQPLQSFIHFLPAWVLGMACSYFREQINTILQKIYWLLLVLVLGLFAAEIAWTTGTHTWYSDLQKSALALYLLAFFRRVGDSADDWFGLAGSFSFGLFFLHSYVITAGKMGMEHALGHKPEGSISLLILASFVAVSASMTLVGLLKKILGRRSRCLIGV